MKQAELVLLPQQAASDDQIAAHLKQQLGLMPQDKLYHQTLKRSIDARGKHVKVRLVVLYSTKAPLPEAQIKYRALQNVALAQHVVIIGCGPAGLFAALRLIELGYRPIIIERGKDVKNRRRDLALINRQGIVNPDSNYCFGEGGAGTYSDGKLYTRSNKRGNVQQVLDTFIEFGANPQIKVDAHPHIGTNKLPQIIEAMRQTILHCGGQIIFNARFTGLLHQNNKLKGITYIVNESIETLNCNACILATGHSARDVYRILNEQKILIEAKPFALGVRIEHSQQLINQCQYHNNDTSYLPAASYSLVNQSLGRGVYSFCMCPGGIIAPAATEHNQIVVNGWSPSRRNNPYANSGMVVSIMPADYKKYSSHGALAAMQYQAEVEATAFVAGGGNLVAPGQRMVDFINNKVSNTLPACSYHPGVKSTLLADVLPSEVVLPLQDALKAFGNKMKGYLTNDAILVATESRTSSPVRIPRNAETCMHTTLHGLFPCAEGAGYAGGIVSAAMDGHRCAEMAVAFL